MEEKPKPIQEEAEEEAIAAEVPEPVAEEPQAGEPAPSEEAEETNQVPDADTPSADEGSPEPPAEQPQGTEEKPEERTFTQEQVNAMVGKARAEGRKSGYDAAMSEVRGRYGVEDDDTLDRLFADGSRYGELNQRFAESGNRVKELQTRLALVECQILPERHGDVAAILAANGLEVNEENINSLLPTHPEWRAQPQPAAQAPAPQIPQPTSSEGAPIKRLGVEPTPSTKQGSSSDEEKRAMTLMGLK